MCGSKNLFRESDITGLVFVGQLADELATYSSFVTDVSADVGVAKGWLYHFQCGFISMTCIISDFREKVKLCRDGIVNRWRSYTISNILSTPRHRAPFPAFPCMAPLFLFFPNTKLTTSDPSLSRVNCSVPRSDGRVAFIDTCNARIGNLS